MKKIAGILLVSLLLVSLLSACASQTTQPTAEVEDRSIEAGGNVDAAAKDSSGPTFHPLQDPNNMLSQRSIYYDYDSYSVKNEYRSLVIAHAHYLRDNPNIQMILQGNTDERGSREYNLALGQRRADGVKDIMTLAGARESQIEAVSLGEEKPRAHGSNESAWSENRRTDIIYRGE